MTTVLVAASSVMATANRVRFSSGSSFGRTGLDPVRAVMFLLLECVRVTAPMG
jgi:hypothetical protein